MRYKFLKYKNGHSSIAAIDLELCENSNLAVEWAPSVDPFAVRQYTNAVEDAIRDALEWHMAAGGTAAAFRVIEFVELLVDTQEDAVRCAATMAAWLTLGHDESGVTFTFDTCWKASPSL